MNPVALGNMGLRAMTLAARFGLAIYLTHMLGFAALGLFGVIAGLAGVLPSILGFGVSYHLNRELLHADRQDSYRMIRDRMAMSLAVALPIWLAGAAAIALGLVPLPPHALPTALIITLEIVAFDMHVGLLNLGRPMLANGLLFVRSASWMIPVIALGIFVPAARSFDMLLYWWLAALIANFALLGLLLRDLDVAALRKTPIDWVGMANQARQTPLVYLNDMAQAGQVYLDRFIVAHQLGIAAAGVYTLFFSLSHGVYLLTAAATTQMAPRRLASAFTSGGRDAWNHAMRHEGFRAMQTGCGLAALVLIATLVILPALHFPVFREGALLFAMMIGGALLRPWADLAMNGLYVARQDRALATINLGGVLLSLTAGLAATAAFGLIGIGLTSLLMPLLLAGARLAWFRPAGPAPTSDAVSRSSTPRSRVD